MNELLIIVITIIVIIIIIIIIIINIIIVIVTFISQYEIGFSQVIFTNRLFTPKDS